MKIKIINSIEEAKEYLRGGYTPIECSFGNESVIDDLCLDHHGKFSDKLPVCMQAFYNHYGKGKLFPQFVLTRPDLDSIFSVIALMGDIDKKYSELIDLIGLMDVEPIGVDILEKKYADLYLYLNSWKPDSILSENWENFYHFCVFTLKENEKNRKKLLPFFKAAMESENNRIEQAKDDYKNCYIDKGEKGFLYLCNTRYFGWDIWYKRNVEFPFKSVEGWEHPIVLTGYPVGNKYKYSIGCSNIEISESLFGKGGLKNIFPLLGNDWGGRESIGGSGMFENFENVNCIEKGYEFFNIINEKLRG